MRISFLLFFGFQLITPSVSAQAPLVNQELGFRGVFYNDSVILRWAPLTVDVYKGALAEGFILERGIFAINGEVQDQDTFEASIVILESSIGLIEENEWATVDASEELKAAAVDLLYNFEYTPPHVDSVNIFSASEEVNNKKALVSFASMLADNDLDIAMAMGWSYIDTSVDTGVQYAYILTLVEAEEKYYSIVSTTSEYEPVEVPKPGAITGDSIVRLTFNKVGLEDYFGYMIQRSSDNGTTYMIVNEAPAFFEDERQPDYFHFVDSLPNNDSVFVYRIAGVTPFGIQGEWSDTIKVQGIPSPLDAYPEIISVIPSINGVEISFEFPEELEARLHGFEVIRSLERTGPFLNLTDEYLAPTARTFIDTDPLHANYYFIRAIDDNGNSLLSIPTFYAPKDSTPASIPTGLSGMIDNSSIAHISWNKNSEFDIKGYKLYGSNAEDGNFMEISRGTIRDTVYSYQLGANVLNEDWYIKIRSIDLHENESELSEPVQLLRPDLIPPSPPVLKDLRAFSFGVAMNWILSPSLDVETHYLQRREAASKEWVTLLDITNEYQGVISSTGWVQNESSGKPPTYNYIDSTVVARTSYQYRVVVYDEVGNIASSAILDATGYDSGHRGEIFDLMAIDKPYTIFTTNGYTPDKDKAGVAVGWNYTDSLNVHHFIIYRSADGWPYKAYQSYLVYEGRPNPSATTDDATISAISSGLSTRFVIIDKDVMPSTIYKYKVVAKHLDGGYSETSEVVSVSTSN